MELARPIRVRVACYSSDGTILTHEQPYNKALGGRTRSVPKLASNFIRTGSCAGMHPGAGALLFL